MQNLLSANLFHLRLHKAFWAAALFMVVYALAAGYVDPDGM